MKSVISRMNDYFFDIEPGEPADWTSALLFYGFCGLSVILTVVFGTLNVIN